MKPVTLLLCVLWATLAQAEPPKLEIPAEIRPTGQYVTLLPKTDSAAITYIGLSGIDPLPSALLRDPRTFVLDSRGLKEGRYLFAAVGSLKDEHTRVDFSVVVGNSPVVVNPTDPNPQVPQPGVPLTGLRVLILKESSPSTALPKSQVEALESPEVLSYLDSKAMDSNGQRRWRKLDPNVSMANLPPIWGAMRAAAQVVGDQPWVVVAGSVGGTEKVVFQGPYPQDKESALAFLKRWGG